MLIHLQGDRSRVLAQTWKQRLREEGDKSWWMKNKAGIFLLSTMEHCDNLKLIEASAGYLQLQNYGLWGHFLG